MKTLISFLAFLIIFILNLSLIYSSDRGSNPYPLVLSSIQIDANDIKAWIRNNGSLHRNPTTGNAGFEWPRDSNKYAIYVSGLWLGCKIQDSIHLAIAEYEYEFLPGYINFNSQTPMGKDDPLYRIYKVSPLYPNGSPGFDNWAQWPVSQGAPWVDINNNGTYEPPVDMPVMKGDQNMFCAFTDGYPESHNHNSASTEPLRSDVHLYSWAKNNPVCADVIYHEYKIINKRNSNWDSLFVGFFSDSDIGDAINDKAGCDTIRNLMYNYKGIINPVYGANPPAVGYLIYEASRHPGRLMDVCNNFLKALEPPINYIQSFNILKGLKNTGEQRINPINNAITRYTYSGDPESGTGWLYQYPQDTRNFMSSYMGTVVPLDTIIFKVAVYIRRGANNLNAVTQLKNCANQIIGITQHSNEIPDSYFLHQNYPNPFNPITSIKFEIPKLSNVKLVIYDVLGREAAELVNSKLNPGVYNADWDAGRFSSGVYFYTLKTENFSETKKMILIK